MSDICWCKSLCRLVCINQVIYISACQCIYSVPAHSTLSCNCLAQVIWLIVVTYLLIIWTVLSKRLKLYFDMLINLSTMTSSNGNIFRVTGHLCGEFTGPGEFPRSFETLPRPLWRHSDTPLSMYKFMCGPVVSSFRCCPLYTPNSKVHGANMGPIWGRQDPGGPHVGPMNFAIWDTRGIGCLVAAELPYVNPIPR